MTYTLYIAGPMADVPEFNHPLFNAVDDILQDDGFGTVNPAALDKQDEVVHSGDFATGKGVQSLNRAAFLKRDFQHLSHCDGIVLLPGWQSSVGANAELMASHIMGLDVFEWNDTYLTAEAAPLLMPLLGPVRQHIIDVAADKMNKPVDVR